MVTWPAYFLYFVWVQKGARPSPSAAVNSNIVVEQWVGHNLNGQSAQPVEVALKAEDALWNVLSDLQQPHVGFIIAPELISCSVSDQDKLAA